MNQSLPSPLDALVSAMNAHDPVAFIACFRPDATVTDERQTHAGLAAIRDWFEETSRKYRTQLRVTGFEPRPDGGVLSAEVSGNFPGSPFPFHYHLTLSQAKITALTITSD